MKNLIFQAVSLAVLLVGMGVTYAAWTTLTASQGANGAQVTETLMQGIINNLNDLQTRMQAVESANTASGIGMNIKSAGKIRSSQGTLTCNITTGLNLNITNTAYGYFDANGLPHVRIYRSNMGDTGWVSGFTTNLSISGSPIVTVTLDVNKLELTGAAYCTTTYSAPYFETAVAIQ